MFSMGFLDRWIRISGQSLKIQNDKQKIQKAH